MAYGLQERALDTAILLEALHAAYNQDRKRWADPLEALLARLRGAAARGSRARAMINPFRLAGQLPVWHCLHGW